MPQHGGGYGRQNRAAYDAMMGMMGEYDELPAQQGGSFGTGVAESSYDPMGDVTNAGDMLVGESGQDNPRDGAGMSSMYGGGEGGSYGGGYDGNDDRMRRRGGGY